MEANYELQLQLNQMSCRLKLKQILLKARCNVTNKLLENPAKMIGCQHLCIYQYQKLRDMQICICGNQVYKDMILVYKDYKDWIAQVRKQQQGDQELLQNIIFFKQMKLVFGVDILKNLIFVNKLKTQRLACWPYCRQAVDYFKVGPKIFENFQSLWQSLRSKQVEIQFCKDQIKAVRKSGNLSLKLE